MLHCVCRTCGCALARATDRVPQVSDSLRFLIRFLIRLSNCASGWVCNCASDWISDCGYDCSDLLLANIYVRFDGGSDFCSSFRCYDTHELGDCF